MFSFTFTLVCTLLFLAIMSAVALVNDILSKKGQVIRPAWMYMLSIAVYGTSWTFFGSVGLAKVGGLAFLPVYLGPTIAIPLWIVMVQKQIRLTKKFRITSMSDMLAARYGKSLVVGAIAALIMIIGQIPYITLQIKSIASTFKILSSSTQSGFLLDNVALLVTILLTIISIYFGARTLDPSEKNEGLMAAVIFESGFKIVIFLITGLFVLFFIFSGPKDLLIKSLSLPEINQFFRVHSNPLDWFILLIVSGLAFTFLPHVYQAAVIGNHKEKDIYKVAWMLPLYLLIINIFVIPVAIAGLIYFQNENIPADTYLLHLPIAEGKPYLSLLVYLAGLGAGAGMSILAAVALAAMMTNNLFLPVLLNIKFLKLQERKNLSTIILNLRRFSLAFIFFLAWAYFISIVNQKSLVSIGLISFVAIIQLAPAMIGGLFWKRANKKGAIVGMIGGFVIWAYTLPLPTLGESGIISRFFIDEGLFGLALLKPYHLLGLSNLDQISNSAFWSMFVNITLFVVVSLYTKSRAIEKHQAEVFVDILETESTAAPAKAWKVTASFKEILGTLNKYMGVALAKKEIAAWLEKKNVHYLDEKTQFTPDPEFMDHVETLIAGVIGQASARVMIGKMASENELSYQDMVTIMNESSEIKKYSAELELALDSVRKLKNQQDGDYFLTSLLLVPFQGVISKNVHSQVSVHLEQKKTFDFKNKTYQLGGDICLADSITLMGQDYTLIANADAMGKSIQGAGGALVYSVILRNIVNINQIQHDHKGDPENWLKNVYRELHNVFLTFDGSMYISTVIGLVNNTTGDFYYFNAEHPWTVLYSGDKASFLENELEIHKLGTGTNPGDIEIKKIKLAHDDVIILGSDGRDDVILDSNKTMNEDEKRFLECVKKGKGLLPEIILAVKEGASLTDDFSLLSYRFSQKK